MMGFDDLYGADASAGDARADAHKRAEMHRGEAIRMLMDSKSGRVFVREFLDMCGVFKCQGPRQTEMVNYHEGLRTAGLWMFTSIIRNNPEDIHKILRGEE